MAAGDDAMTSIPVHSSTLRILQGLKTGAQNWDQFLLQSFEDFLPPETMRELVKRVREPDVPASEVLVKHRRLKERGR